MTEKENTRLTFPTRRTHGEQVFPAPADGAAVAENPPVLIWLPPVQEDGSGAKERFTYRCSVQNAQGEEIFAGDTPSTVVCIDRPLEPGEYTWNVTVPEYGIARGVQRFAVPENAAVW